MCRLCRAALLEYSDMRGREVPRRIVTVARAGGRWQPLCAVYRREFADAAEKALRAGRYKIDALFDTVRNAGDVEEEELEAAGFSAEHVSQFEYAGRTGERRGWKRQRLKLRLAADLSRAKKRAAQDDKTRRVKLRAKS